jgi:hypothetical protein
MNQHQDIVFLKKKNLMKQEDNSQKYKNQLMILKDFQKW